MVCYTGGGGGGGDFNSLGDCCIEVVTKGLMWARMQVSDLIAFDWVNRLCDRAH